MAHRSVSVPTTFNDLERWNVMGKILEAYLQTKPSLIMLVPFDIE